VISVILYGSTSRGELSYKFDGGRLDLFSDYELEVIIRKSASKESILELKESISKESFSIANPLFHVDLSFNTKFSFWLKRRLDRRLAIFEVRENGVTLYGEDILKILPKMNVKSLDIGNLNELILVRLWMQLLYMPPGFAKSSLNERDSEILKYFLARNAMEILTIYLPSKGVLLPTYTKRVNYFSEHEKNPPFPPSYADFFKECLSVKLSLKFNLQIEQYYAKMLEGYLILLECLLGIEKSSADISDRVGVVSKRLMGGQNGFINDNMLSKFRRKRREVRIWRSMEKQSFIDSIRWLFRDKRPYIMGFLLNYHFYLNSRFAQGAEKEEFLINARKFMDEFSDKKSSNPYMGWQELNREIVKFMSRWLYNNPVYLERLGMD